MRMRILGSAIGLVAALVLTGCGDDPPRWGAVGDDTCASLDLAEAVAKALPQAPVADVSAESRAGGLAGEGGSDATCRATVEEPGGNLSLVVELASSGTSGDTSLYALRDQLDGEGVESASVQGWWATGVRLTSDGGAAGPVRVNLVVEDDNLVVAVRISDRRGPGSADLGADTALADALVAAIPDVVADHHRDSSATTR